MTYVYYILSNDSVKVGVTSNPKKRLKQLQTGNDEKLKIAKLIKFKSSKKAFEFEKMVHKKYKRYRKSGEWFDKTVWNIESKGYAMEGILTSILWIVSFFGIITISKMTGIDEVIMRVLEVGSVVSLQYRLGGFNE